MLVLSRRPDEKIVLPTVPAVIKVISAQAGLVRLGIEAPAAVPILREELVRGERSSRPMVQAESLQSPRHAMRNRLNNLMLGVTLLRMHMTAADPVVRQTLAGIEEEVTALKKHLGGCPDYAEAVAAVV